MSGALRRLLFAAAIAIAALILALALGEQLREEIVAPILYTAWALSRFLGSFPQAIYWAIFLTLALVLAIRSLHAPRRIPRPEVHAAGKRSAGRVATLARRVHESTFGDYFKRRLARHLLELALQAKGYPGTLSPGETKALLQSGRLGLPASGQVYLENLLVSGTYRQWGLFERLRLRVQDIFFPDRNKTPCDPRLIELIEYLEKELEIEP
jgi:hypothetical protein